jgi:hypothetical protein
MKMTNLLEIENTRRVTVVLSEGVTAERLISLLNERKVKVFDGELRNGHTGELLAEFVDAINSSDYKVHHEQSQWSVLDDLDIHNFNFNKL